MLLYLRPEHIFAIFGREKVLPFTLVSGVISAIAKRATRI